MGYKIIDCTFLEHIGSKRKREMDGLEKHLGEVRRAWWLMDS